MLQAGIRGQAGLKFCGQAGGGKAIVIQMRKEARFQARPAGGGLRLIPLLLPVCLLTLFPALAFEPHPLGLVVGAAELGELLGDAEDGAALGGIIARGLPA